MAIVVPTLDEEEGVGFVLDGLNKSLDEFNYTIVVVDGDSTDRTVEIAKDKGATVIKQRGTGYGDALCEGLTYAVSQFGSDILVIMDGDGSYPASSVVKMIRPILNGKFDMIVARRCPQQGSMPLINRFGNIMISLVVRILLNLNIHDTQSGGMAFRNRLVEDSVIRTKGWAVNTELLKEAVRKQMRVGEVDVAYLPRKGETKQNILKGGVMNLVVILRTLRDRLSANASRKA
jgi:glycosyltransferase involved in cell wall biosynthesis